MALVLLHDLPSGGRIRWAAEALGDLDRQDLGAPPNLGKQFVYKIIFPLHTDKTICYKMYV